MTFERLFSGRMLLMRIQRHVSQAHLDGLRTRDWLNPQFHTPAGEQAFFIVEQLLCELEREFEEKKKRRSPRERRRLDREADRQVMAGRSARSGTA